MALSNWLRRYKPKLVRQLPQVSLNGLSMLGQELAREEEEMFRLTVGLDIKVGFSEVRPIIKEAAGRRRKFNQIVLELSGWEKHSSLQSIDHAVKAKASQLELPDETLVHFEYVRKGERR